MPRYKLILEYDGARRRESRTDLFRKPFLGASDAGAQPSLF